MLRALLLLSSFTLGCAAATPPPRVAWATSLGLDHPLAGRIYTSDANAFVDEADLLDAVSEARWLLLGERHDHPDHHLLQARLLRHWLRPDDARQVGFEMLDEAQAPALQPQPTTSDALAAAVRWEDSNWPDFGLYRPVFDAILEDRARVVAAHPSRQRLRAAMMDPASVPDAERARLELGPLPPEEAQALDAQIERAHCGYGGVEMRQAMAFGQRYKDAFMADALRGAGAPGALIAGAEHVRRDRGVPLYLRRHGEEGALSVGFIPVDDARLAVTDYEVAAFDYVWFTPRTTDRDPCDEFREQLERMSRRGAARD